MKRPRRVLRGAALAGLIALTTGFFGSGTPASADQAALMVRSVDASSFPEVRLIVEGLGPSPVSTAIALKENGATVENLALRPVLEAGTPVGTVLAIDSSASLRAGGAIDRAKEAARGFVAAKTPAEWIAVVSFSNKVVVRQGFTQDQSALTRAIDELTPSGGRARRDATIVGARLYADRGDLQPNMVLLTGGADTASVAGAQAAQAALSTAHVRLHTVSLEAGDATALPAAMQQVRAAVGGQYEIAYRSVVPASALVLELAVGDRKVSVLGRAGSAGVAPAMGTVAPRGGPVRGAPGKFLVLGLAATAAGLLAAALLLIFGRRRESLEGRLEPYAMAARRHVGPGDPRSEDEPAASMAETGFVQRAVRLTSNLAGRTRLLEHVGTLLEQANLPLRAAEALFFYCAGVVVVGLLAIIAAPSVPAGLVVAGISATIPVVVIRSQRRRRLKAFEAQLPDTLNLVSGSLRAGYSFLQGLEAVAQETSEPTARELRRVLTETRLGRSMEEALSDTATRMESRDFDWAVMAIRIQREVGGNLAELLQTVADTMLQRSRMRGEIKALTAEGRLSAVVMGCLPLGLGLFMMSASPEYITTLFQSATGWALVIGSGVMAVAGFAWLQKIVKIEV